MASKPDIPSPRSLPSETGPDCAADAPDAQLLTRFANEHDDAGFALLMQRHGPMVWGVCQRVLRNVHDAEDAFQAVFLVLARKARSLRRPERLGNWLYGVAYRTALKGRAARARRCFHEGQAAPPSESTAVEEAEWRDLRPVLDEELNRLLVKYRTAIVLYYLEGLTQEEIARRLGCPRQTIATRLARGCARLRVRLTRRGVALSAAALATALSATVLRASPPARVVEEAARNAAQGIKGPAAASGAVPPNVADLTKGVLRDMWWRKMRIVAVCALSAILVALGAGVWSYHALADKPAVQEKDKKKAQKKNPIRQTVEKFLAAALAGKADDAEALAEPGQITARKIKDDFRDVTVARLPLGIASLQADDQMALAVTENVTIKDPRRGDQKGPLLITVKKIDKGWRVRDVDFGKTEKRIAAFKKMHPKAKAVP